MTESMVSAVHYNALKLERDELAARVERLERVSNWVHNGFHDEDEWDKFMSFNRAVYSETPPSCLLAHDAEVIEEATKEWLHDGNASAIYSGKNVNYVLSVRARELRNDAEGKG
jgi:hypothetical protein